MHPLPPICVIKDIATVVHEGDISPLPQLPYSVFPSPMKLGDSVSDGQVWTFGQSSCIITTLDQSPMCTLAENVDYMVSSPQTKKVLVGNLWFWRHRLSNRRSSLTLVNRGRPGDCHGLRLPSPRWSLMILENLLCDIPWKLALSTCLCPSWRSASTLWQISNNIDRTIAC